MSRTAWLWSTAMLALVTPARAASTVDAFLATPVVTPGSAAAVAARCEQGVALAGKLQAALETGRVAPTAAAVLGPLDDDQNVLNQLSNEAYLVSETNPDKAIRDAGEACFQRVTDLAGAQLLSRAIYDKLAALPKGALDPRAAHSAERQLLERRLAGATLDPAKRAQALALQKQITASGLKFDGDIRDADETTNLDPADLAGMPDDYIASHRPAADGKVHIGTSYPDVFPLLSFADKESTRRAVYMTFSNRAYPQNGPVLKELITERDAYARLLGYRDFASLALADKMVGTPARARALLQEVNAAATPAAQRDYAELLARWRRIDPAATTLPEYDRSYVGRLLRKEKYDVDSAVVRRYFTYIKVRTGIFQLVHDLFGADIRPWNTPVWADGVTAWELYDKDRLVGRFYLDPYPRAGKYSHAAEFPLRSGVAGRLTPIGSLITNFPKTGPMEHGDVTIFLHEFGHLLHLLYSGNQTYAMEDMNNVENDFVEAPSQLLEEWTWDYDTLARFASDAEGRPIPRDLVERMNRARKFGQGISAKDQLAYSAVSLDYYTQPPATLDFDADWDRQRTMYSLAQPVPGVHEWASFGHLNGYSATYYTYVWSKALALDLFTRFQKAGLRDGATAMDYRRLVLEPGSSEPAETLVTGFLGRPISLEAYKARLQGR